MGRSARHQSISFSSYVIFLGNESEKPSSNARKFEISLCMRDILLEAKLKGRRLTDRVFERAAAQPDVRDGPWYHTKLLCMCGLAPVRALASRPVPLDRLRAREARPRRVGRWLSLSAANRSQFLQVLLFATSAYENRAESLANSRFCPSHCKFCLVGRLLTA